MASLIGLVVFYTLVFLMIYFTEVKMGNHCPESSEETYWKSYFVVIFIGASGSACLAQVVRIFVKWLQNAPFESFSAHFTALTIMMICFSSEVIALTENNPIIIDIFGERHIGVQYIEWLVTSPLVY